MVLLNSLISHKISLVNLFHQLLFLNVPTPQSPEHLSDTPGKYIGGSKPEPKPIMLDDD